MKCESCDFLCCAVRLNRPVRCMLDRDEDMLITGGRHPFYGKYKVGGRPLLGGREGGREGVVVLPVS